MSKRKKYTSDAMQQIFGTHDEFNEETHDIPQKKAMTSADDLPPVIPKTLPKRALQKTWDKKASIYLTEEEYEMFHEYAFKHRASMSRAIVDLAKAYLEATGIVEGEER